MIAVVILSIASTEYLQDVIQRLLKNNVPVVLFDRDLQNFKCHSVLSENKMGAFDDNIIFSLIDHSVCAISQDIDRIAHEIIRILLSQIRGKSSQFDRGVVLCEIYSH